MLGRSIALLALAATTVPAFAHPGHASGAGAFVTGFAHPLLGVDHVLAMVAVGMWAVLLAGRALWIAPPVFVMCMVGGFALALTGTGLPAVEPVIAASVVIIGLLIAVAVRLSPAPAAALIGLFAVFHGNAHGAEFTAAPLVFALGFAAATSLLLGAGILLGRCLVGERRVFARGLGGVAAGIGLILLGGWS